MSIIVSLACRERARRRAATVALVGAAFVFTGMQRNDARPAHAAAAANAAEIAAAVAHPHLLFRETAQGATFGRLTVSALDASPGRLATAITCDRVSFAELGFRSKKQVLHETMSGDINSLGHQLNRFSERNRHFRDFTLYSLISTLKDHALLCC